MLDGGRVGLVVARPGAGVCLQPAQNVLDELSPLAPGLHRDPLEVVPESVVIHVDGTKTIEDCSWVACAADKDGLCRVVIDSLQGVRIERAHERVKEGNDAHELQDSDEFVRPLYPEAFPGGEQQRSHLACAEQDEFANIGSGVRQVGPQAADAPVPVTEP